MLFLVGLIIVATIPHQVENPCILPRKSGTAKAVQPFSRMHPTEN